MKFTSPGGKIENREIEKDYESAVIFEKLRVGDTGVFFKSGFAMKYLPYDYLERVFLRIHEVEGKLCCGSTVFQYFRIVFVHDGKEFADIVSENEKVMREALAAIGAHAPQVKIGIN